jgi:hypothetical protein
MIGHTTLVQIDGKNVRLTRLPARWAAGSRKGKTSAVSGAMSTSRFCKMFCDDAQRIRNATPRR